jgi:hypothetical protein
MQIKIKVSHELRNSYIPKIGSVTQNLHSSKHLLNFIILLVSHNLELSLTNVGLSTKIPGFLSPVTWE